ncbi:hypothetical protein [Rahnella sp. Larv3_ips]|uniref:hypothetical protein n=1 Tax=Rahnella sp. Larv3_ips TaxID=1896943 RepID=UPI000EFD3D39|nr:hypothetical protein [Rahnella sp. Larv3_ips]
MKELLIAVLALGLAGCAAKPYEPTKNVDEGFSEQSSDKTKIRIHRAKQLSGSALGDGCPLLVFIDEKEAAGLQQNQYADLYLTPGVHSMKVRFSCALTEWSKSLAVTADGKYKEYETEIGAVGQYRMWQIK